MASFRDPLLGPWALLVLLAPISLLIANSYPLILQFGAILLHNPSVSLTRYSNHGPVNNQKCDVKYEANACEDVSIHFPSNTAFVACGDPEGRAHWYPPSRARDAAARRNDSFREDIFKYDIKSRKTVKLKIGGLEGDFISHGIDLYSFPDDPKKIHVFAVNHGRDGDSILIFSHMLGSDSLQLVKKVQHRGIKTANGVAASGPLDFFTTNDHYFASGVLRDLEDKYGPFPGATNVQYCDASNAVVHCRQVSPSYPNLNGIAISDDKSRLYVADSTMGTFTVFNILQSKDLVTERSIGLGAAADNIKILPVTGDPIIAVFPTLENLPEYLANIDRLGRGFYVPSAAVRLDRMKNYVPQVVFWDGGSVLSYMTAGAIDPYNRVFVGAGVLQYGGFVVCDLPEMTFE